MSQTILLIAAIVPIAWLFVGLCILHLPGHAVCPSGLLIAAVLAFSFRQLDLKGILTGALEGALFAWWPILLVVLAAMILYRYSVATGGMDRITELLSGISSDERVQVLILAWGFGGFLEGIAGFGTPVLIPGCILVALGMNPFKAIVVCLIANTAATPFATLGIPVQTMAAATGLDLHAIGVFTATQLFLPCLILPFLLVVVAGGSFRAVRGVARIALLSGLSFAVPLWLLSYFAGPTLPTLCGSICAMFCTAWAAKRFGPKAQKKEVSGGAAAALPRKAMAVSQQAVLQKVSLPSALLPYILVIAVVFICNLIPPVHDALARIQTTAEFFSGENPGSVSFAWILTPGILILVATFLACAIHRTSLRTLFGIMRDTFFGSYKMIITILTIVAMAKVMNYAGMMNSIAIALVAVFGGLYPLIAPLIGTFGVFITGSDTTCAILLGTLQQNAALQIGANPTWIASANMSGAAIGKMLSPQSIAIGYGIGGIGKSEGDILVQTLRYGIPLSVFIGVIVFVGNYLLG